jgi:Protein of unknown function (DUF3710)
LFRRRRDAGEGRHEARAGRHERHGLEPGDDPADDFTGDDFGSDEFTDDEFTGDQEAQGTGPWDSREQYPQRLRVDVGSLLIPANEGQDVGLELSDDQSQFVAASVDIPEGKLQIRALAAPKSGALWEDERAGIIETIGQNGGQAGEAEGPFGPEVHALEVPHPDSGLTGLQPARFLGVDGPRWLLLGKISGPAAASPEQARVLEEAFADIVVVRGDHPAAPRDLLDIMLPAEMREALAQQMAEAQAEQEQEQAQQAQFLMPIERGPEITETR